MNINLFTQININQMFDKIQMILMMKTSISNNRISRLNDTELFLFKDHVPQIIKSLLLSLIQNSSFLQEEVSFFIPLLEVVSMIYSSEAATRRSSVKKVFFEISQNS